MSESEINAAWSALRARQEAFMEEGKAIAAEAIRLAEASEVAYQAAEAAARERRAAMRAVEER